MVTTPLLYLGESGRFTRKFGIPCMLDMCLYKRPLWLVLPFLVPVYPVGVALQPIHASKETERSTGKEKEKIVEHTHTFLVAMRDRLPHGARTRMHRSLLEVDRFPPTAFHPLLSLFASCAILYTWPTALLHSVHGQQPCFIQYVANGPVSFSTWPTALFQSIYH